MIVKLNFDDSLSVIKELINRIDFSLFTNNPLLNNSVAYDLSQKDNSNEIAKLFIKICIDNIVEGSILHIINLPLYNKLWNLKIGTDKISSIDLESIKNGESTSHLVNSINNKHIEAYFNSNLNEFSGLYYCRFAVYSSKSNFIMVYDHDAQKIWFEHESK